MQDAWRAYLELALGVTEASKKKAQKVAKRLVGKGGATAAQLQTLAEEVLATGTANREALTRLVRSEVDRALGVVGLAKADEVADLSARVRELEGELRDARSRATVAETAAAAGAARSTVNSTGPGDTVAADGAPPVLKSVPTTPPAKTVAKKTVAKKVARKTAATTTARGDLAALPTPGAAEPTADGGRATPARKAPAKKAPARKAAKKTTPPGAGTV
jgi:polyhydroxyalkanoate synthesis regulator phasin